MTDKSAEVATMERKERLRWTTLSEGRRIVNEWKTIQPTIQKVLDRLEQDPDDQSANMIFIVVAGIAADGFVAQTIAATKLLKELAEDID